MRHTNNEAKVLGHHCVVLCTKACNIHVTTFTGGGVECQAKGQKLVDFYTSAAYKHIVCNA